MTTVDLIIIGAGPGGYEVAAAQGARGRKVVLVERDQPGGTCLNRGCIPTKCLCAAAGTVLAVADAAEFGVDVAGFTPVYARAAERMRAIVDGLRQDVRGVLRGVQLVEGEARFNADGNVAVRLADGTDDVYCAPTVLIATGSKPSLLPIPGAELAMTSDDFLRLDTLPENVVVIGGGVIGLEFASIMAAYGVEVTVVEFCKEVLPPFDADIAKRLRSYLSRRGIKFVMGAAVTGIAACDSGGYTVTYRGKKGDETVETQAVLMAVGRRPVLPEGLVEAGIEVSPRGFIVTDSRMQTTRPGVYAVGDCNGRMMLAHAATAQAEVALGADINLDVVPAAVFTTPEAAMVGMTEAQAKDAGMDCAVGKAMFAGNGKARAQGDTDGFVKVIIDRATGRLLGCHILGPHAADLIAEPALAIANGLAAGDIVPHTIHAHPTLCETLAHAIASAR